MSDNSPRLDLPLLQAAQAQKHVTHNEALRVLDVLVQLSVDEFNATTPPGIPEEGKVYALGAGPSGAWTGEDHQLATWVDASWQFHTPQVGWQATLAGGTEVRIWTGGAWSKATANTQNLSGVGINTASDSNNRLSVASPATLLTHEGAGHQVKVNKATSGDTASLLFQTNWSGRAEMGLAGDDSFSIKVSADGSAWDEVFKVSPGMQIYHSGNIVGTVSATPGIGDAIIEAGSNANGTFTKYADGTMVCAHTGFATAASAAASWTFPAAFATASVSAVATAQGTAPRIVTLANTSATAVDVHSFDATGDASVTPSCDLVATGRWF